VQNERTLPFFSPLSIVIALAATLPFLHKAYHIDDVLYFSVAQQILRTPWSPFGDPVKSVVMWDAEDGAPASLFETDYNPPLWKYVLAAVAGWWGPEEWKPHLVGSFVVVLAAVGIERVSRRWTDRPIWCVAMILMGPFFLPGQNCMLEVPVLCLAAWATEFQLRSWETGRAGPALVAGTLVGLAVLTKYTSGLLIPIFVAGSLLHRRPMSALMAVPAFGIVAVWSLHNLYFYGEPHLTAHGVLFQPQDWPIKALTVLRIIGGVSIFWPIWLFHLARRGTRGWAALAAVVLASLFLAYVDVAQASRTYDGWDLKILPIQQTHFWVFTFGGSATVLSIAAKSLLDGLEDGSAWWSASTDRFLEGWLAALVVFNVTSTPFNAVRHLLLAFVAMTWLSARQIPMQARRGPVAIWACSAVLAYLLAAADYEIAGLYRDIAQNDIRRDIAAGKHVWFTGNWGFVLYASREGAHPLFVGTEDYGWGRPAPGDRVYHPILLNWRLLETQGKEWVDHLQPQGVFPLRTIVAGAHYYSVMGFGLPWECLLLSPETSPETSTEPGVVPDRTGYQFPPLDHVKVFEVFEAQKNRSPWQPEPIAQPRDP
jgi:hypothetical protein